MIADCPVQVIARLQHGWNAHDLEGLLACFQRDYQSIHPCHPNRNFSGLTALRASWGAIFEALPDFRAELCRYAVMGDTVWTEWRWQGTHSSGIPYDAVGVMIFKVIDDQIMQAVVYSETLQTEGPDWDFVLGELLRQQGEELEE
jgi:ketosteroid isomerase-like protein